MKKYFVLLLFIALLLITGCTIENPIVPKETKTLACTKDISTQGVSMIQTANMKFIGDKVDSLDTDIIVTLPDKYKTKIDTFYKSFKNEYEEKYGNKEHVKLEVNKQGDDKIIVTITFDTKNMTAEEKKATGFVGSEEYEASKAGLEKSGYVCK